MNFVSAGAGYRRAILGATACLVMAGLVAPAHAGKSGVAYKPGVAIVPEVLMPDGQTARTYNTTNGLSLWTNTLPVVQGDKVKINVFAATGGAELKEIIVRLDNKKIADIASAPWNTLLDSTMLGSGHHMIEVWAQSTGDHPQSTTQTLMFYVAPQLAAQYVPQQPGLTPITQVAGTQQSLVGSNLTTIPLPGENNADTAPTLDYLKDKTVDSNAQVAVYARSSMTGVEAGTGGGTMVTGATITVNEPTLLAVQPTPGSTASQFAYALVRAGRVVYAAPNPYDVTQFRVRVQKLNASGTGLASGPVTLWVWGVDKAGQPSEPVKTVLNIP